MAATVKAIAKPGAGHKPASQHKPFGERLIVRRLCGPAQGSNKHKDLYLKRR